MREIAWAREDDKMRILHDRLESEISVSSEVAMVVLQETLER